MNLEYFENLKDIANIDKLVEELMESEEVYACSIIDLYDTQCITNNKKGYYSPTGLVTSYPAMFVKRNIEGEIFLCEIITGAIVPILKTKNVWLSPGHQRILGNALTNKIRLFTYEERVSKSSTNEVKLYILRLKNNSESRRILYNLMTLSKDNIYYKDNVHLNMFTMSNFIPLIERQKQENTKDEESNDIFPRLEKKTFSNTKLLEQYQKVEMLLNKLKLKDYKLYIELKYQLDNIASTSVSYYEDTKKELKLYDKDTVDMMILQKLYTMEAKINLLLNMNEFEVDASVELINLKIEKIKELLHENAQNVLDEINKLSEIYNDNKNNISYMIQIDIAKKISYLYLLAIKKYNIDKNLADKLKESTYIEEYENWLILLIMELLEKGIIITNKYEELLKNNDITLDNLFDIINDISFIKKTNTSKSKTRLISRKKSNIF